MKEQFTLLTATRANILKEMEACTPAQLCSIPKGFNNNILWNAIHVIVTPQVLLYMKSNTACKIDTGIIESYRKGTIPSEEINYQMIEFAKNQLIPSVSQIEQDYSQQIFGDYETFQTSYGVILNTIEDAIRFNNLHESMHYGQIKMLKRLV
ncbi:DinB family protein [Reichenbachiella agarivorans]|uniref:DinB family protein n=1 Tax=Reichenbachiella agarivorans TaxID=2979464 RepID=A0ABY6CRM2_9BACT|nr:DinB family protein [Reichenbachiella agarivorans]UXP32489.1 DinB family protein [Reichenbachiella agarivorans]